MDTETTARLLGPDGKMWVPVKIRLRDRVLLYRPEDGRSWASLCRFVLRTLTARWAGQAEGSYSTGNGRYDNWCGWCGHKSFTKRQMLKHSHPRTAPDA
jgi:hypothetical protein